MISPFRIAVADETLDDLRTRLDRTRYPDQLEGAGWRDGTELGFLVDLVDHWRTGFDWRAQEARLNRFDHVRVDIDGLGVHAIHARSPHAGALPLLITHGWPGSVVEFLRIIGPLTDPVVYGGRAEDSFHVVCPSMPGYGFSDAPSRPGFDIRAVARVEAALMRALGYTRYGAQGGDWGAHVSIWLGIDDPGHCCGVHLNMVPVGRPPGEESAVLSAADEEARARARRFREEETGYQAIQTTRPQSLAYALNDSPAGLAAWIVEKFRVWSDCDGDLDSRFHRDDLLANITVYWVTRSIASSMRLYRESRLAGRFGPAGIRVEVPTACAIFPRDLVRPPRRWAELAFNLTRWTEMPRGGHFAAMEEPELLVDDVRAFFHDLRR